MKNGAIAGAVLCSMVFIPAFGTRHTQALLMLVSFAAAESCAVRAESNRVRSESCAVRGSCGWRVGARGSSFDTSDGAFTGGVGVEGRTLAIDYAFASLQDVATATHRVGIRWRR